MHVAVAGSALAVPLWAIASAARTLIGGADVTLPLARWGRLLTGTAEVCGIALGVAAAGGTLLGLLLGRSDLPGRRLLAALVILAACVPLYVAAIFAFAWLPAAQLAGSRVACGILYGVFYTPLAAIVLGATFRAVDRDLEEAALLDAQPAVVLRRVTLRQAAWGFAGLALLLILLVGTDFTIPDLLFVRTFAEETHTQYILHRQAAGPILTGMPLAIVLAVLMLVVQRRYRLLGRVAAESRWAPPRSVTLGRGRIPATLLLTAGLIVVFAPPTISLLAKIGSPERFVSRAVAFAPLLVRSIVVAGMAATITVAVSVGLAWGLVRGGWLRWGVGSLIVLTLALPAPVAGISLIEMFDRPGLLGRVYDSPALIVWVYLARFLAIGVLLAAAAVQRVPLELEDLARMDGASWALVQRVVYWPAARGHALVAWLVVMVLCFADVGATKFVVPPGWDTAAVVAFAAMHARVDSNLAVLALLSVVVVALAWAGLVAVVRAAEHHEQPMASSRAPRPRSAVSSS